MRFFKTIDASKQVFLRVDSIQKCLIFAAIYHSLVMSFITTIEKYALLTPVCKEDILASLETQTAKKGRLLLTPTQINTHLYFVERGLARVFYDTDTVEITSRFVMEGEFLCVVLSFFSQQPSNEYIEILEDSSLLALSFDNYTRLLDKYPELGNDLRKLYEKQLQLYETQSIILRERNPTKKYAHFLALYPRLAARVQAKYIASYLNIHPSAISTARNDLKKKG